MRTPAVTLDDTDRTLIRHLHGGFPLVPEPFAAVGSELGLTEDEVLARLDSLFERGVLTRFGPLFQVERMGGAFCLAAMAVPEDDWTRAVAGVNAFPEVAHNYRREHALNMWFVLATATPAEIEHCAARITAATGYEVLLFPKEQEFFVELRLEP